MLSFAGHAGRPLLRTLLAVPEVPDLGSPEVLAGVEPVLGLEGSRGWLVEPREEEGAQTSGSGAAFSVVAILPVLAGHLSASVSRVLTAAG